MLWLIASILLLIWIVSLAFKDTVGASPLLLLAAVVLYIWGFFRGRTGRATV